MSKDSYQVFLDSFQIKIDDLYRWGISSTIFPDVTAVDKEWKALKQRVFTNQTVYIRGYGRNAHGTQLFIDLYKNVFNNSNVKVDPSNNTAPQKNIELLTKLKRNKDILNYQVSHIWGRTKNILMFEAPWNICYTPKLIDPFTGHETKGNWPKEFQKEFTAHAHNMYQTFIDDYNQLLKQQAILAKIDQYLKSIKSTLKQDVFLQFERDVHNEFGPI